ncbi:MAG: sugar phosphate isomerase/epimerase family protein [Planctomycetota bacterium]
MQPNRRTMLSGLGLAIACSRFASSSVFGALRENRKFTMDLCPGRLGVNANQIETIQLGKRYGFESVEPLSWDLVKKSPDEVSEVVTLLKENGLVWGAGGLPVEFRKDDAKFKQDLEALPDHCKAYESVGVTRIGTWMMPTHASRTYRVNFELHASRLRQAGKILADHGLSLGLEYVGPRTLWSSKRYAFIHTMAETKELLEAIGLKNVGFVLDSWHWYTAEETVDDLKSISTEQIIAVDLNDAPAGIPINEQIDNTRALPAATGVIDVKQFLATLIELGYDGPIRAEPFDKNLNAMENEPAVEKTSAAMKKAFALIGG